MQIRCSLQAYILRQTLAMAGLELELGFMHKLRDGSSEETLEEFVSLKGYSTGVKMFMLHP